MGLDSLILACTFGRTQNVKFWISKFQDWNINRGNTLNGATALQSAVYFGRNKMKTVQALLESGRASLDVLSDNGASVLISAVDSTDSNIDIVRYLLSQKLKYGVNHRRVAQTTKWKLIYGLARGLSRLGVATSGLFAELASESGSTPLHYAVRRGDVEIVELLMKYKADPYIKNDLGRDVLSYCESFPEIKGAIERVQRETRQAQGGVKLTTTTKETRPTGTVASTKGTDDFTLQRRLSTASGIKYDMYLMSLPKMMKLFGSSTERKKNFDLCHQDLLKSGDLTRFEDLPMGTFTMFISHEWLSRDRPDPFGVQLSTLCQVLRKLRDGKIDRVSMKVLHRLIYKHNFSTTAKEWNELLTNAYIWFDWWSQPQPSMEKVGTPERCTCEHDLAKALQSTAAYVMFEVKSLESLISFFSM